MYKHYQSLYYIDTFDLFEGDDARAITIQREQYGGIVHLFIGTGRSSGKITFMVPICIHNHNINHQGLTSLFLFGSASCFDLRRHLKPKQCPSVVASAIVVIALR